MKNVALIGAESGARLALYGRAVAGELGFSFFDVDAVVAGSANMSEEEIRKSEGDYGYLIRESLAIYALVSVGKGVVVAVGRQALESHETTSALHIHCVTVWVKGGVDDDEFYAPFADVVVCGDEPSDIADAIKNYRGV